MFAHRRLAFAVAAGAILSAGTSGSALAADNAFGQHVSECAHTSLGPRADAPAVTCSHDGMTMTFDTFGAMVQHMRDS